MQKDFKMCSLFSGIGGLELGLEAAVPGLRTCWQVEQDDFCRRVLAKHWPDAERFDDVRTVEPEDIRGADVLCGGFPCQDISVAGKGAGLAGDRSGLWWEMHRLISLALPRVVVAENVPALTSRGLSEVLSSLAQCGYSCEWDIISAASVGAWHRRDRLFIIARRDDADTDSGNIWDGAEREALGRNNVQTGGKAELAHNGKEGASANPESLRGNAAHTNSLRELQQKGGIEEKRRRTSDSGEEDDVTHPSRERLEKREGHNARRVLPRLARGYEGAAQSRICPVVDGLPRGMARRRREQIKALGNSVVPQVAYQVGLRVKQILEEMDYE
jgi:DNA-cytosine methyltransferase